MELDATLTASGSRTGTMAATATVGVHVVVSNSVNACPLPRSSARPARVDSTSRPPSKPRRTIKC